MEDGAGLEDEGEEGGGGQVVGHLPYQAQGAWILPGGNGGPMKGEKDRITGT